MAEIPINHSLDVFEHLVNRGINYQPQLVNAGVPPSTGVLGLLGEAAWMIFWDFLKDLDGLVRIKVWMFQDEFWRLLR